MNEDHPGDDRQPISEQVQHHAVTARVPDAVSKGAFATGASILQANDAFVVDFLSAMTPPVRVTSRVVMSPGTFHQFVLAMEDNYGKYTSRFQPAAPGISGSPVANTLASTGETPAGAPSAPEQTEDAATLPPSSDDVQTGDDEPENAAEAAEDVPPPRPSTNASDLYEHVKLPDEMLGGVYANSVMIRHDAHEFAIDFIANFYPRSVVTSRVFLAAGRMEILVRTIRNSWRTFQTQRNRPPQQPPADDEEY